MGKKFIKLIQADGSSLNNYDSELEVPSGKDKTQNAWLTLRLKVHLNFANPGTDFSDPIVCVGGKYYAKDADGWLFPVLRWNNDTIDKFNKGFVAHAQKVWNWQFLLLTPDSYEGLDISSPEIPPGWKLRPNVLCLFRLNLVKSGAHKTINVVRLDQSVTTVNNIDPNYIDPQTSKKTPSKKVHKVKKDKDSTPEFTSGTWRSDDEDYDDSDLFRPSMAYLKTAKGDTVEVAHDTIGHEIGHALGQAHILGLEGIKKYKLGASGMNDADSYGKNFYEQANIMGKGSKIYILNAISWTRRIGRHTGTHKGDWKVVQCMTIPPSVIPKV